MISLLCYFTPAGDNLVGVVRDVLVELLAWDDSMARRAAAETLALMGLKIGDGYAVYLIQVFGVV